MEETKLRESEGLTFWLARPEDYEEVMSISGNVYGGSDYLPHCYKSWMTEPKRVVIIARKEWKLVALQSAVVVDEGQSAVMQAVRVSSSERRLGISKIIGRFVDHYITQNYPSVRVKRATRNKAPDLNNLKCSLVEKRAYLSLNGEAENFDAIISTLKAKLGSEIGAEDATVEQKPQLVELEGEQLKKVLLDPDITSRLDHAGGLIIQNWLPLKLVEGNLEILGRSNIIWLTDRLDKPSSLSCHILPFPVPYKGGSLCFNIEIYGRKLDFACKAFLAHLQKVELRGSVVIHVFLHCSLWEGLKQFCQCSAGWQIQDYSEQFLLEQNI